jgi:hypothetical protein
MSRYKKSGSAPEAQKYKNLGTLDLRKSPYSSSKHKNSLNRYMIDTYSYIITNFLRGINISIILSALGESRLFFPTFATI